MKVGPFGTMAIWDSYKRDSHGRLGPAVWDSHEADLGRLGCGRLGQKMTLRDGTAAPVPDLVERDFTVSRPNAL